MPYTDFEIETMKSDIKLLKTQVDNLERRLHDFVEYTELERRLNRLEREITK